MRERISLLVVITPITNVFKMSCSCNLNFTIARKACGLYIFL